MRHEKALKFPIFLASQNNCSANMRYNKAKYARQGPCADQCQPAIGAQQERVEIAVGESMELLCRRDEFDLDAELFLRQLRQRLRHCRSRHIGDEHARGRLAGVEQGGGPDSGFRVAMHDGLLIRQAGVGQPGPFQARVAHVDDQNHADPIPLPCNRGWRVSAQG